MLETILLTVVLALPVVLVLAALSVAGSFIALFAEQGLPPAVPRQPAG
jgi:hypothetical protein